MESWINSRSLMIGNVSTEESRKEIRKSPGAPSPLANATTFCFHPLRLDGTHHSSHQFIFSHRRAALPWSAPSPPLGTKSAVAQTTRKIANESSGNYCAKAERSK